MQVNAEKKGVKLVMNIILILKQDFLKGRRGGKCLLCSPPYPQMYHCEFKNEMNEVVKSRKCLGQIFILTWTMK